VNTDTTSLPPNAPGFCTAVLRAVTWRALLVTQGLGALFALTPWLEHWGLPTRPNLPISLTQQSLTAAFLMLAAFAGDEAVHRGWTVMRAFVVTALCMCGATALCLYLTTLLSQWGVDQWAGPEHAGPGVSGSVVSFFEVGSYWGPFLMVYLNRQSATRLLASVRKGEMDRAQAEGRIIGSGLAAVEAQMDPVALSRQLKALRDSYAAGDPEAESKLESLIADLRNRVAQCQAAS
jgi:hypothetical protein